MPKTKNTTNWPLVGNENIGDFLLRSVKKAGISGSYIFSGPDDLGKTTAARYFAQVLLCASIGKAGAKLPCRTCPACKKLSKQPDREEGEKDGKEKIDLGGYHGDLYLIKKDPEKKNIAISEVREFIKRMQMGSFLGNYKVGIIKDADFLSPEAANALLKTLEEPKKKVVIILTVTDMEVLLPTIISRSQVLHFTPVPAGKIQDYLVNELGISRSAAKNYSRLCLGRPALAVKFAKEKDYYNNYLKLAGQFLEIISGNINERLAIVDSIMAKKLAGQAGVKKCENILEIWQGLARDFILNELGHFDLIQNEIKAGEIKSAGARLKPGQAIKFLTAVKTARKYLEANVNPKLVLEELVINL